MSMEPLGRGGFGEVWLLTDTIPKMVMKKALQTDDYAGYLRELRTLKELAHENVVRYYDAPTNYPGIDQKEWLIFMEYCEHGSLKDILQNKEIEYSLATVAKWSTEMFSGLKYIKSMKKIHHDIKPDNLFIYGHDYILKLGDFGIARDWGAISIVGGTPRYMAPEVLAGLKPNGEDIYKCDIYGAGWVVFDMVQRSNPGNKIISNVLRDGLPHLETIKKLVVGCTLPNVFDRLCVGQALDLCEGMVKEFEGLHARPDPNPFRKRLEPPIGLVVEGQVNNVKSVEMTPPGVASTSTSSDKSGKVPEVAQRKVDPRERLLMDLKEQFGLTTLFDTSHHCFQMLTDVNHRRCGNKTRRALCDEILEDLAQLSIEHQYECVEQIERKRKMPELGQPYATYDTILGKFYQVEYIDRELQSRSHDFAFEMLFEADRPTLPYWDTVQLIEKAIMEVRELDKLFIRRRFLSTITIDGSRHTWFETPEHDAFLRTDYTDMRPRTSFGSEINRYETGLKEPVNNEQLRRALVEAGPAFKKQIINRRLAVEQRARPDTKLRLAGQPTDWGTLDSQEALSTLDAISDQPFKRYVFLLDAPPAHSCSEGTCAIAGGFPSWADADLRINYHQCSTKEQIDYIEDYTLMVIAFKYILRKLTFWNVFWFQPLIDKLIAEIELRERSSAFFFGWFETENGAKAMMLEFNRMTEKGTFLTREMELVYSPQGLRAIGFLPMKLTSILPTLRSIRDVSPRELAAGWPEPFPAGSACKPRPLVTIWHEILWYPVLAPGGKWTV